MIWVFQILQLWVWDIIVRCSLILDVFFDVDNEWWWTVKQNMHLMNENEKMCRPSPSSRQNMHLCRWSIILNIAMTDTHATYCMQHWRCSFFYRSLCVFNNYALTDTTIMFGPGERWRNMKFASKYRMYALLDIKWNSLFDSLLMFALRKRSHSMYGGAR